MGTQQQSNSSTRVEHVGRSGIYPASGPLPPGEALVRGQGQLAHPEERVDVGRLRRVQWPSRAATLGFGRALFGGFFLYNGIQHFVTRRAQADYARSKRVPLADLAVLGSGALILVGGLSLLTGVRPRFGASLIATFLLGVSPKMHNFWAVEDEHQRTDELINFTKNMALLGGACLAAAVPEPWPWSLQIAGRQHTAALSGR